jgi:hypothetical protein
MKLIYSLFSITFIFVLALLYSCGSSVAPSLNLQQKASKILDEGDTWGGPGNVEVLASPSGVVPTDLENLQVSFKTSGPDDWAPTFFESSGADDFLSTNNATWIWTGSGTDNITLDEASVAELTSVDVTEETITFSFEVNVSIGGGRITGIDGFYTVRLK